MFRCESERCGRVTAPHQPVNRIVTEWREKMYENKIRRGKRKGEIKETFGREIVREIKVCPECYVLHTGDQPVKYVAKVQEQPKFERRPRFSKDDRPRNKKWRNPRKGKGKFEAKGKQTATQPEKKKPVVQVINPLSAAPIVKE